MLIIGRIKNERFYIGSDITITVADIREDQVRIGIDAPATVNIVREELVATPKPSQKRQSTGQRLVKAYRDSRKEAEDHRLTNTISAAAMILLNMAAGLHENEADGWELVEALIRQYAEARDDAN